MGISLVCSLGPGIPDHLDGACRSGIRQTSAAADHAGMVYETRRPDPGIRMEFKRCQPARAGMGGADGLPDREGKDGEGGSWIPETDLSKAADQLHVVDQPEGREREQYVRRRLPGAGQYWRIQPQSFAGRGLPAGTGRRDELDGDVCAEHDGYGAGDRDEG